MKIKNIFWGIFIVFVIQIGSSLPMDFEMLSNEKFEKIRNALGLDEKPNSAMLNFLFNGEISKPNSNDKSPDNKNRTLDDFEDSDDSDSDTSENSIDKQNLKDQVGRNKNNPAFFFFSKSNISDSECIVEIQRFFAKSGYNAPEKRLELLENALFDGFISKNGDLNRFYLSKKDGLALAMMVILSGYIINKTGFDFDLDYLKILELVRKNVADKNLFKPHMILSIINYIPTLENILNIRYEKISEQLTESNKNDLEVICPTSYREAFSKLLLQIAFNDLSKFNFEDRENLLRSLAIKITESKAPLGQILHRIIVEQIGKTSFKNDSGITINGVDLKNLKRKNSDKLLDKIKAFFEHTKRVILDVEFEINETKSDSDSETDSDSDEQSSDLDSTQAYHEYEEIYSPQSGTHATTNTLGDLEIQEDYDPNKTQVNQDNLEDNN